MLNICLICLNLCLNMLNYWQRQPEYLRQNESKLSLTVEQILVFATSTYLVGEVKNLFPNFN